MEQNPSWEANRSSVIQEIPRILWNPQVYHRIPNSPPLSNPEPDQSSPCLLIPVLIFPWLLHEFCPEGEAWIIMNKVS